MGGMMGGGMRSVPATSLPHAILRPGQTRHLPTRLVSLNGPNADSRVNLPQEGEALEIGDISQLTEKPLVQAALKQLAAEKAPETVAQLVMWNVAAGLDWASIRQLAHSWANPQELALARQFVGRIDPKSKASLGEDPGRLYWDVTATDASLQPLASELRTLLNGQMVLGLKVEAGVPSQPKGPSIACVVKLTGSATAPEARVAVSASDGAATAWTPMGQFSLTIPKTSEKKAEALADAAAEGVLGRLVRAQLTKGPRQKGKETYRVRVENASPLILNGLALAGLNGTEAQKTAKAAALAGISLAPRRSLTINAGPDVVERLGLKTGIKVVAADLSGL